jgi:hypothetical protein
MVYIPKADGRQRPKLELPEPTRINGRLFFERLELENAKRQALGMPLLERDPTAPIELVPAPRVAEELGRHRRTVGRRIVDARRRAGAEPTEAA